jgi:hypothetical protein
MKEMVGDKLDPELLREKVTKAIKLGTGMIINYYYRNLKQQCKCRNH